MGEEGHSWTDWVGVITPLQGHGRATSHRPELILNGFNTRLGRRVGRMLGSLFHQDPAFRGRRVVTFHNQRDFVFFR
jgi:ribosome production factor 1